MNLAKAKDHFSAYYEGSLERGLRQQFETRLREDAQLQAEYRAFERTMKSLEALGQVEIEPPVDLHDRIAARLDKVIYDQKRQTAPAFSLTNWWKGFVLVGVAAAGIAVGVIGWQGRNASQASVIPMGSSNGSEQFSFAARNKAVAITYPSVDHQTVIVKDSSGKVLKSIDLDHRGLNEPIQNQGDNAFLVSVETSDQSVPVSYVAIPGRVQDKATSGKGTLKDLAVAIAGHYNKPVIVQAKDDADKDASWDFSSNDAVASANAAVKPLSLAVTEEKSGVITIQKY